MGKSAKLALLGNWGCIDKPTKVAWIEPHFF
jgi:hypothetical protein